METPQQFNTNLSPTVREAYREIPICLGMGVQRGSYNGSPAYLSKSRLGQWPGTGQFGLLSPCCIHVP